MSDLIERQAAIDALDVLCQEHRYKIPGKRETYSPYNEAWQDALDRAESAIGNLPSAQTERLTDDDFETIRIHLNAYKEKLCNQHRWEEAEEYQRIIDRFMAFASAQTEIIRCKGKWIHDGCDIPHGVDWMHCSVCGRREPHVPAAMTNYCPYCGADMRGES